MPKSSSENPQEPRAIDPISRHDGARSDEKIEEEDVGSAGSGNETADCPLLM